MGAEAIEIVARVCSRSVADADDGGQIFEKVARAKQASEPQH
jgi:hypothetical protein